MSAQNKKKLGTGWVVLIILLGLTDLALLMWRLTRGHNIALFNPKGFISGEQHSLILLVVSILLVIGIPSVFMLYFIAWKYRETNTRASYDPHTKHGRSFNAVVWAIPTLFMLVLASIMWPATHRLEPQKVIAAGAEPLTIQVISTRWKWVFLYPEQQIATVNFVQLPVYRPVQFELTADQAPMSSFWIPNLGGQLYTMTGMVNHLNLMAETPGDYPGSSAEINGAGFAGMKFTARASDANLFDAWVEEVKKSSMTLDASAYTDLLKPSENNPAAFYAGFESGLYDTVVMKYAGSHGGHTHSE